MQDDGTAPPGQGRLARISRQPASAHARWRYVIVAALAAGAALFAVLLAADPDAACSGRDAGTGVEAQGALGIVAWLASIPNGVPVGAELGRRAPDFRLERPDGGTLVRLSDFHGRPVLRNFWATWCGPCRREMPDLTLLQDDFAAAGLVVLGVNIREPAGRAQAFAEELGLRFPLALDRGGDVTDAYLRIGPPNTFLIDGDGVIRARRLGQIDLDEMYAAVTALLAESE